jgi:hypothetical protein
MEREGGPKMRRIVIDTETKELVVKLHQQEKLVPWQISKKLAESGISISTSVVKLRLLEWGVYDVNIAGELKYSGSRQARSDETKERMKQASLERWSRNDGSIGFSGRIHSPETYKHWQPFTSRGEFSLKERLERKGYKQGYKYYSVGKQGAIAVFDFYHEKWRIALEIDGEYHFDETQSELDGVRDRSMLNRFGIRTIRIREKTMKIYKITKGFGETPDLAV